MRHCCLKTIFSHILFIYRGHKSLDLICFADRKATYIIPDARGGHLHCPGEDHAGLQDEGDVQAQHGRARAVHVSAGHPGPGAHP